MLTALAFASAAFAADWPMLQGTEPGVEPAAPRVWGFTQVLAEGLAGPFNFSVRRARIGVRGDVPKTDGRANALMAVELGSNGLTRSSAAVLADASVTLSYVPGVRLRMGKFKLPIGEEALEMNPAAADFVNFTATTQQLLGENRVVDGAYAGGFSGYRDVGIQAFDTFALGSSELSYALVLSNGAWAGLDTDAAKDVTARLSFVPWHGADAGIRREEIRVWTFWQHGRRDLDGDSFDRIRRGAGIAVRQDGWSGRAEVVNALGMVELGPQPSFPGSPIAVAGAGVALGGNVSVQYRRGIWAGGVRYDVLHRAGEQPSEARRFHTPTLDLQAEPADKIRILLDYELRFVGTPEDGVAPPVRSDRISLQLAALF
jgi:hypothetical protein